MPVSRQTDPTRPGKAANRARRGKAANRAKPDEADQDARPEQTRPLPDRIAPPVMKVHSNRWLTTSFALIVVLPTILAGFYYALIASDQYETRTLFAVRGLSESPLDALGFSNILGSGVQQTDSYIVADYIQSIAVIEDIRNQLDIDLRQFFARPDIDFVWRIDPDMPVEDFSSYWKWRISIAFNSTTGISTFEIRAFSANDAEIIASAVMKMSEQLINDLSRRARDQLITVANAEVKRTEDRLRKGRLDLQSFLDREQTLDPTLIAQGQLGLINELERQLAELQTRRGALGLAISPTAPSARVLDRQIAALTAQIEEQKLRLGSGDVQRGNDAQNPAGSRSLNQIFTDYVELNVEVEFAEKAYTAALTALEAALTEARTQQRYFAVFQPPRKPTTALYPRRIVNTISLGAGLLISWFILVLTVMIIRDHAL